MRHGSSPFKLFLGFGLLLIPLFGAGQEKKGPDKVGPFGKGPGMMGQSTKIVAKFDKDGDKRLDTEERKAAREYLKKERPAGKFGFGPRGGDFLNKPLLEALDTDKDGQISSMELESGVKQFMARADREKKDAVEEARLAETLNELLPRPKDAPFPGKGGPGGGFGTPLGTRVATSILQRADADKNSKTSLKELLNAAQSVFRESDKDKNGKLDGTELGAAVALILPPPGSGFGKGGPGKGGFGFGGKMEPAKPGPKVSPTEVKTYPDSSLYEPSILRTIFIDFDNKDWEAELQDFIRTDVEVPATVTVDGKKYPNVGIHFRGMSSLMSVSAGYKRSLNLSFDFVESKQRLYGYKTLNLLNSNGDPSMMSTVLFSHLARKHIPAPKANFVKVVINGESWGVYVNVQQFNKEFVAENYKSEKGARWHVKGSPGGDAGLYYVGDKVEEYKRRYDIRSKDDEKSWTALIHLCKVLTQTPVDKLETELAAILDIDEALWFLALDICLLNSDGYWVRASDYNIYLDPKGKFHIIPHDMNEAFQPGFGGFPGFGKGGFGKGGEKGPDKGGDKGPPKKGGGGVELDPLTGMTDVRKPLRSRLLQVPKLRERYLEYVRTIAQELDWKTLGPVVSLYRNLIEKEVELDTRKLSNFDSFKRAVADTAEGGTAGGRLSLRAFADQRRTYLLNHPEVKALVRAKG